MFHSRYTRTCLKMYVTCVKHACRCLFLFFSFQGMLGLPMAQARPSKNLFDFESFTSQQDVNYYSPGSSYLYLSTVCFTCGFLWCHNNIHSHIASPMNRLVRRRANKKVLWLQSKAVVVSPTPEQVVSGRVGPWVQELPPQDAHSSIPNHILIELPYICSYRNRAIFFLNCMLFVAWGISEIACFPSSRGMCYPIRSSSTLATSVRVLATPLFH